MKHNNKQELIDTRPQSVVVENPRSISRSSTKHDLLPVKNLKLHKPGALPGYLKKTDKEATKKIETVKNETKGFEKSVETGDFSEKVSVEMDLQSKINELKIEQKTLSEENKILKQNISNGKEKELNERKLVETLEGRLADFKKDNKLLNLTMTKITENYSKEQELNRKLKEKFKNYEEENKTSQAYSEVAKKISDKKVKVILNSIKF